MNNKSILFCNLKKGDEKLGIKINKYYYPDILKVIADNKIPMWPFWSAAVPRATYFPNFIRESNAVVESSFNLRKNVYRINKNVLHTDYAQEAYKFHDGTLKVAVDKAIQLGAGIKTTRRSINKKQLPVEDGPETWCRRTPKSKIPKHFTVRSPKKYASPKSKASSYLRRKRTQIRLKTINGNTFDVKYLACIG